MPDRASGFALFCHHFNSKISKTRVTASTKGFDGWKDPLAADMIVAYGPSGI